MPCAPHPRASANDRRGPVSFAGPGWRGRVGPLWRPKGQSFATPPPTPTLGSTPRTTGTALWPKPNAPARASQKAIAGAKSRRTATRKAEGTTRKATNNEATTEERKSAGVPKSRDDLEAKQENHGRGKEAESAGEEALRKKGEREKQA